MSKEIMAEKLKEHILSVHEKTKDVLDSEIPPWDIRRAVYDVVMNQKWDIIIDSPFIKNAHPSHIQDAINICRQIESSPDKIEKILNVSREFRGDET